MGNAMVERAKNIIFAMEGNYGTVCVNDCGALSIGCVQWHAGRAKTLLQIVVKMNIINAEKILPVALLNEIQSDASWKRRIVNNTEKMAISGLLITDAGMEAQNILADTDIQSYINHISSMGYINEETIIFLADIENQGGSGASTRIGNAALKEFKNAVTLKQLLTVACNDSVFSKYKARRQAVYRALTESVLLNVDGILGLLTINALQKFLKISIDGTMNFSTIKALQVFLNSQVII